MKKIFYSLLCIIGLSACSTENVALDSLRVYDVANSTCKLSISPTETRPDFYAENNAMRPLQNSLFKICSFHHIFVPL